MLKVEQLTKVKEGLKVGPATICICDNLVSYNSNSTSMQSMQISFVPPPNHY